MKNGVNKQKEETGWYQKGEPLLREIAAANPEEGAFLWFLGQLGFVIKINALLCYIDVILNELPGVDGKDLRRYAPPFPPAAAQGVDYFLCTHNHADHLNLRTLFPLAQANPQTTFIVPMPLRKVLIDGGIEASRILGAREGETLDLAQNLSLIPVAAAHTDYEQDENGDYTCLGYVFKAGKLQVYHAGDTLVTPRLVETLKAVGPLSAAILPINGGDWERTARNIIGNMSIEDAVKLAEAVPVDLVIPAHYDMMPGNGDNPGRFTAYLYEYYPAQKHHVFALGEGFHLSATKNY
ncbi:MAG: MBL fold metallo-hydrolase [Treponema sp.]|nr:MBL fold metallo-hydrolase [Treponema sp.]